MARRHRGFYGRSRRASRPIGIERALQHIEEAKQLSQELGGSDKDVKSYFFSLTQNQLQDILDAYEEKYGREARNYAATTLPKWRSGRVTMSGMVATRLFNLLPPRMPLAAKYKLTEGLWQHLGPRSRKVLRVGVNVKIEDAINIVQDHIERVVVNYKIPETLERRFNWLSAGDVHVKQDLMNHLQQVEKSLVVDGARAQLPIMLSHIDGADGANTHRLAQILRVGNHEIEIVIEKELQAIRLDEPPSLVVSRSSGSNMALVWGIVLFAILIIFLVQ